MRAWILGGLALLAGCSAANPCDGLAGTCVDAHVGGAPATLDQLRITVDGQPNPMVTPATAGVFSLPVDVAIVFSTSPGATAAITIDGLSGGNVTGSTGKQMVPLTTGGKTTFDFTMTPVNGGGDGGGGGDMPPDLLPPPNVISFIPSTLTFPATPRGTQSPTVLPILVTNNTDQPATTTAMNETGDMMAFDFDMATTTCPQAMGQSVPAHSQCMLGVTFKPDVSGALQTRLNLTFADSEMASLMFNGTGTPAWSFETPSGATTGFTAVWGSSSTDWWAVGHDSNCPVWRSTGNGMWTNNCDGTVTTQNFFSVAGSGPNDVTLGGDNGDVWRYHGGANWTHETPSSSGTFINGTIFWGINNGAIVDSNDRVFCTGTNGTFGGCPVMTQAAMTFSASCLAGTGVDGYLITAGSNQTAYFLDPGGSMFQALGLPNGLTGDFTGAWVAPNPDRDLFLVGSNSNTGVIVHGTSANAPVKEAPGNSQGGLYAVAGRVDPMGKLDVYAVGGIGPQVLHTTGDGQWSQLNLPGMGMAGVSSRGVWVTSDGQVMVVGDSAQIFHYY